MPLLSGSIVRQSTGEEVARFAGVAGGEISFLRSPGNRSAERCHGWGAPRFARPLQQGVRHQVYQMRTDCAMQTGEGGCLAQKWRGCKWHVDWLGAGGNKSRCY